MKSRTQPDAAWEKPNRKSHEDSRQTACVFTNAFPKCLSILLAGFAVLTSGCRHQSQPSLSKRLATTNSWAYAPAKLLVRGSAVDKFSDTNNLAPAKHTVYELQNPRGEVAVALIFDRAKHIMAVARGGQSFYISDHSQILSVLVSGGSVCWRDSFLSVPSKTGREGEAISRFLAEFDEQKLQLEDGKVSWISLAHGAPYEFFTAGSLGGSQVGDPKIEAANYSEGILYLNLISEGAKYSGNFWIDLERKELVKSAITECRPDFR